MACRGVHFAITHETMNRLLEAGTDEQRRAIIEEIESAWDKDWLCQTDKAWDAIHRCLTDGKLEWQNGAFPLNACVLGGQQLHQGDDYIISLVKPEKVPPITSALSAVTKDMMRQNYFNLDKSDYDGPFGEDDYQYTWSWFEGLLRLFQKASQNHRAVIFTVDL